MKMDYSKGYNKKILEVNDLHTFFYTKKGVVKAIDGVSFDIDKGEIVGLVGESGCGKSVTSLSIMRLVPQPAGRIVAGQILFNGEDLQKKTDEEMRQLRGDRLSMILQDPMVSMNQILTVGYQLGEVFKYHGKVENSLREKCIRLLERVKVPSPECRIDDYPFQFSGGMCQRVLISMGVANNPDLLIADEPTTALDVTIRAQILNLMREISQESNTAIILITHDLATVAQICTWVIVMYAGRIVEQAPVKTFYRNPSHPYTVSLIKSVPVLGRRTERLFSIGGTPPNLLSPPLGCRFASRCDRVMDICKTHYPPETEISENHRVSCWLHGRD
jgi:oligopeptide/dipeptide ABC transporter ATP-binding protein